jgi:sigma-B regulation protein RsbU (phosphoserine phosphatase)
VLASINTILYERQLEEYYCTLCYAVFDFKRRTVIIANSGLPYPVLTRRGMDGSQTTSQIELAGVPLGSFPGSSYEEITLDLMAGDLFVFCSDGVFEAQDEDHREFGADRLLEVVGRSGQKSAREIVGDVFASVQEFRGETSPNDDMTAVAVRITA